MKIWKNLELVDRTMASDNLEITEEVLDYYERNPGDLNLIIDKEYFHAVFLGIFFVLGLVVTLGARVLRYVYGDYLGEFVNDVVLDVISEVGIAVFGGAVVAYLIEYLKTRQYQQNIHYRNQIKKKLDERMALNNTAEE